MADGKTPSPYEIAIFGGPHTDLPLAPPTAPTYPAR
jgi:hypothetical protein